MALSASTRISDALDVLNICRHKFEGIFDMHGVKTGSPEDVSGFLNKLSHDRYFAMDFWGLVGSLEAMGDRMSDRQIRRTVTDCVCGEWLPNDDPASVGINRIFDARVRERAASEPTKPHAMGMAAAGEAAPGSAAPQVFGSRITPVVADSMGAQQGEFVAEWIRDAEAAGVGAHPMRQEQQQKPAVELGNLSGTSSAEHIDQMLSRLEMLNLELKLHLDNIDSRVSRLEPHIEELTTQVVRSLGLAADAVGRAAIAVTPLAATSGVVSEERAVVEAAPVIVAPVPDTTVVAPYEVMSEERADFSAPIDPAPVTPPEVVSEERAFDTVAFDPVPAVPDVVAAPVPETPVIAPREMVSERRAVFAAAIDPAPPTAQDVVSGEWAFNTVAFDPIPEVPDVFAAPAPETPVIAPREITSERQSVFSAAPVDPAPAALQEVASEERTFAPVAFDPIASSFASAGSNAEEEPRVSEDVWPAVDWVRLGRSARGVGPWVGVAACLALILWLWMRPRTEVRGQAPVAVSAPAAMSAPKVPATNAVLTNAAPKVAGAQEPGTKAVSASSVKEEVQAEIAATINKAAAIDDSDAANAKTVAAPSAAGVGATNVSPKAPGVKAAGGGGYVAAPWTKWYGGAPQGSKTARTDPGPAGAKSEVQ